MTLSVDADIVALVVAKRSVSHFGLVAIVESFTPRHAVQLARVRRFGVRDPLVEGSLERNAVEFRALLLSKIGLGFGAVLSRRKETNIQKTFQAICFKKFEYLCVAREIFFISA